MNLEFNIAVHLLSFLVKHFDERFNSTELAERICVNPVQLRRVTRKLNQYQYLETSRGKVGRHRANITTARVNLAELFILFNEDIAEGRIYTEDESSNCEISREIGDTKPKVYKKEQERVKDNDKGSTV